MPAQHLRSVIFIACLWAMYVTSVSCVLPQLGRHSKRWILGIVAAKGFVALTMGHLDMVRFVNFVSHFANTLDADPWAWSLDNPAAEFPYPPALLYLHTLPFLVFQSLGYIVDYDHYPAIAMALIRLPFLAIDVAVVHVLARASRSLGAALVMMYLCSPIILFHQIYSGQLDLIPVYFAFLYLIHREGNRMASQVRKWTALTCSLTLKPFAWLYAPLILTRGGPTRSQKLQECVGWVVASILSLLFSWPFLLMRSYRSQLGASSSLLVRGNVFFPPYLFFVSLGMLALAWPFVSSRWPRDLRPAASVLLTTLLFGATTDHSAGWMVWALMARLLLTLHDHSNTLSSCRMSWNALYALFCLRWATVDHSPCFFSAGVFVRSFLNRQYEPQLGSIHRAIAVATHASVADTLVRLTEAGFSICCIAVAIDTVRSLEKISRFPHAHETASILCKGSAKKGVSTHAALARSGL